MGISHVTVTQTHTHAYTHIRARTHTHTICPPTHSYKQASKRARARAHTHTHTHTRTHAHSYARARAHTHTHTYCLSLSSLSLSLTHTHAHIHVCARARARMHKRQKLLETGCEIELGGKGKALKRTYVPAWRQRMIDPRQRCHCVHNICCISHSNLVPSISEGRIACFGSASSLDSFFCPSENLKVLRRLHKTESQA